LTYREPYQLSADAFAVVALVRGSARANESSIVASEIDRDISGKPVPFELALGGATIDPSLTYTIQATIIDGENAWVTAAGVPVLTKGNPSAVEITLSHRPDLLKGAVSGQVSAVGLQPTPGAYAMAVLVDPATGASLGIDVKTITDGLPVAFAIGYTITDINPSDDYVVTAEVGNGTDTWRNVAGVPVITNGNPKSGIQVVVTEVAVVAPSPSSSATPSPTASPAPVTPPANTPTSGLLPWIILIALIAAVAAFFIARRRNRPDEPTPEPPATASDGQPTTPTDAPPEATPDAGGSSEAPVSPDQGAPPDAISPSEATTPEAPTPPEAPASDPDASTPR
jgi:uncharacterized lipoprotein YbaY